MRSEAGGQAGFLTPGISAALFLAAIPTPATSPGLSSEPVTACGLLSLLPATAQLPGQSGALYEKLKSCHVFSLLAFQHLLWGLVSQNSDLSHGPNMIFFDVAMVCSVSLSQSLPPALP